MVGTILFNLIIEPLELVFEVIFNTLKSNPGIAIIAISVVMNFLALPLYKRADDIQTEERDKVQSMAGWVSHIKKTFKGDERYMMLTEYYRSQNYKQIYSLRSTFPLLLQVPFFIAAYHYLSNLSLLNDVGFLFLKNLGEPDRLIHIGSFSINLMPIIMTLINVVSAYIYLRGFPLKDKIQTYGIAAIFLILLYNSPSGLVFYWTCNQIFSVCKNIVMKLFGAGKKKKVQKKTRVLSRKPLKPLTFFLGGLFISTLLGIMIPVSVLSSAPTDFTLEFSKIVEWVVYTFSLSLGFFVVWLGIYYYLGKTGFRTILTYAVWIISGVFAVDYLLFHKSYGIMNSELVYDRLPVFATKEKIINFVVVIAVAAALAVLMYFFSKIVNYVYIILLIGTVGLSVVNFIKTADVLRAVPESVREAQNAEVKDKVYHLSKRGKNVVVFMVDRANSGLLPFVFDEKPELKDSFDGFTYYPNTLSHGMFTVYTTSALFGGYDYTVEASNARSNVTLKDKQDEALTLMPKLFSAEDYEVTVTDPPYAGYTDPGNISIYDGIENVTAYNLSGKYNEEAFPQLNSYLEDVRKHNMFMYSVFSVFPSAIKGLVYNGGNYMSTYNLKCGRAFINAYSALSEMVNLTEAEDSDENHFLMIQNAAPHEPAVLQVPEYEPAMRVTSDPYMGKPVRKIKGGRTANLSKPSTVGTYHSNMAAMIKISEWLDYLKEEGVYDNTRIIIVADHGSYEGLFEDMFFWDLPHVDWINVENYNPLLMVKDFGDTGELVTDDTFMTNADVPSLALAGVAENPVNPYTGNKIDMEPKKKPQLVTSATWWGLSDHNGYTLNESDGYYFRVHGNIFDSSCWESLGKADAQ